MLKAKIKEGGVDEKLEWINPLFYNDIHVL